MKTLSQTDPSGRIQARFFAQPGYGRHIIRHQNAYVAINRQKQSSSNHQTGEPHETITLTTLYAHRHIFEELFAEVHKLAVSAKEGKTIMYACSGMDWQPFGDPRRKRPLASVILDIGIKERIVDDVKDFLSHQKWYIDRGIPYRRGYLLYGPPGSGKRYLSTHFLASALYFVRTFVNFS
jgi:chaperone BCS1